MFGTDEELLSEEKQKLESNHANIKNKDERRIALGIELVEKFGFSYRDASSLLKNKINYGTLRYRQYERKYCTREYSYPTTRRTYSLSHIVVEFLTLQQRR